MPTISQALAIALTHHEAGRFDMAEEICRRVLAAEPNHAQALHLDAAIAQQRGDHRRAVELVRRAIQADATQAHFYFTLGESQRALGRMTEAIGCYRRAVELNPGHVPALNNLGAALRSQEQPDAAIGCYRQALAVAPDAAELHGNLGNALKDQGRIEEALACYRRAVELKPDSAVAHSNLAYGLYFCPGCDAAAIYEEHRRWNRAHAQPLAASIEPHANDRTADRRLRVGYVSPYLRDHVIGRNLVPLLVNHDHQRFEVFCYCDALGRDPIGDRLRASADRWHETSAASDEQLARLIRADRIDILVDLSLHLEGNRLRVFARRPAPVQVTFAGYPGTTGLSAIDYRLTDPHLDPPGANRWQSEQSLRLPDTFWCYDPLGDEPAVGPLPALDQGCVTFGCLNNFCKVNGPVLQLWAEVLRRVERSRLILLTSEGTHRQRTLDRLAAEGVAADRVTFLPGCRHSEFLQLYHRIDLGLDTFPYNGHTTSLDALWMGVPVVTRVGQTPVGRAGLSQLANLGLPELAASTPEQFVETACRLASDLARLADLRATLRPRMQHSPLMDAPRFARNVEAAYRDAWERSVASGKW